MAMARTERRTYYAGLVVVIMTVVTRGLSAEFGSTTSTANSTSTTPSVTLNSTQTTGRDTEIVGRPTARSSAQTPCVLVALERFQEELIHDMLYVQNLILIEYRLVFPNNTINPLTHNMKTIFKGDTWARVKSRHGQTLLSLAFNYGILSLKALTIGTEEKEIPVADRPLGCMLQQNESDKIRTVLLLLMRDFKTQEHLTNRSSAPVSSNDEGRVCYEKVKDDGRGFARFVDRCCFRDRITHEMKCETQEKSGWLKFLYTLLATIRFGILAFGPLFFLSTVAGLVREEFPYSIALKEPLIKDIVVYRKNARGNFAEHELKGRHILDLRNQSGFAKLRDIMLNAPIGTPFRAKISQYDIRVGYKRLLTENMVPVGFWRNVVRNVFFCKLRHVGPFIRCCRVDMLRQRTCRRVIRRICCFCKPKSPLPWILLWKKIGLILLIILLPTPYYIRLFIYYKFESTEVLARKEAAARLGLTEEFENSLVHYLLPTHPLFIGVYSIYAIMAFSLAYVVKHSDDGRFRKIIVGSFTDLKKLSWINVMRMMIANMIWPFQRYGLAGCVVALIYWPIAIPFTCIVNAIFYLPTVYLTIRMFIYSKRAFLRRATKRPVKKPYRVRRTVDKSVRYFEASYLMKRLFRDADDDDDDDQGDPRRAKATPTSSDSVQRQSSASVRSPDSRRTASVRYNYESVISEDVDDVTNVKREKLQCERRSVSLTSTVLTRLGRGQSRVQSFLAHCAASSLCVAGLYSVLIVLSECVGCLVEVLVFTLMGVIVNAGSLLKFIALAIMLVVYSYDCFNNVEKKYLKLNKALFAELKMRIRDLEMVTSLPSFLQENRGFKSQEQSEQPDYETPDDVANKPARHWLINDLVLFIDNEDMPRIPRKLFEDVCRINVAGVPGPIYRGHLDAMKHFLKIVVFIFFVFVVIVSFGSIVEVSTTNQMIAALAGGSLPFILRTVMQPEKPEIEIGTVSFKNQMDEIIRNFVQCWPIYDLPFEVYTAEEQEKDRQKKEEEKSAAAKEGKDCCDRDKDYMSAPGPTVPLPLPAINECQLESGVDMVDGQHSVEDNHIAGLELLQSSIAGQSTSPSQHVCFDVDTKAEEPEVDIVVYLPNNHDEAWLDEWSDLDNDDAANSSSYESVENGEVFAMKELT